MNGSQEGARPVVSFAKLESGMPMPNLLDVQLHSFAKLVETEVDQEEMWDFGLDSVFRDIFPVADVNGKLALDSVTCRFSPDWGRSSSTGPRGSWSASSTGRPASYSKKTCTRTAPS